MTQRLFPPAIFAEKCTDSADQLSNEDAPTQQGNARGWDLLVVETALPLEV
jgi:hypothetical protein